MTFQITDFSGQILLNTKIHNANPNRAAELTAIASLLSSDPTTHDATIQAAPAGLQPGNAANSKFTNDILAVVNAGKGGNLSNTAMSNAITAGLSSEIPPVNTSAPAVTGTGTVGQTLNVTNGNWNYVPTSYAYQWRRDGANIAGATSATYLLVAADSTHSISCSVTATNAAGSTVAPLSNAIAVT